MMNRSKKTSVSLAITLMILATTPKETKAQMLEGALIGAGIGAVVGVIMTVFKKKPEVTNEEKNEPPGIPNAESKTDSSKVESH